MQVDEKIREQRSFVEENNLRQRELKELSSMVGEYEE
jgi:hypothetical protein